jgi:hypothetical protein
MKESSVHHMRQRSVVVRNMNLATSVVPQELFTNMHTVHTAHTAALLNTATLETEK